MSLQYEYKSALESFRRRVDSDVRRGFANASEVIEYARSIAAIPRSITAMSVENQSIFLARS